MLNYCIKLKFNTALHVGKESQTTDMSQSNKIVHNDTLFSALVIESQRVFGNEGMRKFIEDNIKGKIKFSSLLPYKAEHYLIPRPIIAIKSDIADNNKDKSFAKKMKKLSFLPASMLKDLIEYYKGNQNFDADFCLNLEKELGKEDIRVNCKINRERTGQDNMPYYVGTYSYNEDSGLYFILSVEDEKSFSRILKIIKSLGYSGLGGRINNGLGKFCVEDYVLIDENAQNKDLMILNSLLTNDKAQKYMTLSLCLPKQEEIKEIVEGANYSLVKRSGFIQSYNFSDTLCKKRDMFVFNIGSTFKQKFTGDVFDVSPFEGNHKVYRHLKPFWLGVDV